MNIQSMFILIPSNKAHLECIQCPQCMACAEEVEKNSVSMQIGHVVLRSNVAFSHLCGFRKQRLQLQHTEQTPELNRAAPSIWSENYNITTKPWAHVPLEKKYRSLYRQNPNCERTLCSAHACSSPRLGRCHIPRSDTVLCSRRGRTACIESKSNRRKLNEPIISRHTGVAPTSEWDMITRTYRRHNPCTTCRPVAWGRTPNKPPASLETWRRLNRKGHLRRYIS